MKTFQQYCEAADIAGLTDRIQRLMRKEPDTTFTLEQGRGQTYHTANPVLYAHGTYERSSVLAGQEKRSFIDEFDSIEEARSVIEQLKKAIPGFEVDDWFEGGGSSHVDVDAMTRHLPDEDEGDNYTDEEGGYRSPDEL